MSVLSVKTAVTWAKPLRENERVDSRPGVPASAVSIGNVTCFSISRGESELGHDACGTRLLVEERADQYDFALSLLGQSAGCDGHRLSFLDDREVGRTDVEFNPNAVEVDDHEQLRLEIVPSDRHAKIALALGHAASHWRADLLAA